MEIRHDKAAMGTVAACFRIGRKSLLLGLGAGQATAYGCDFTEGYITENAAYYSS